MSSLKDLASLIMVPSLYKDGELHTVKPLADENIIVHPDATDNNDGVDGTTTPSTSSNFTFSRGSNLAATRVDVNGLIEKGRENVLRQSNQFDTTWAIAGAASVTGNQAGYDGTNNAWLLSKTAAWSNVSQSITNSGVKTFSVYAKANASDWGLLVLSTGATDPVAYFDLANGVVGVNASNIDALITPVSGGWYRISIVASQTINAVRIYPAEANTASGSSGNIYIQDAQLESGLVSTSVIETTTTSVSAGILEDMPRLDYSASCPSLLLEPSRTNLVPQSEYLASFSGFGITITTNYGISPEGIKNATRFQTNAGVRGVIYDGVPVVNGSTYILSMYVKSLSGNQKVRIGADLGCTNPQGAETFDVGTEWIRVETTITSSQSSWNVFIDNVESGINCTGTYLAADLLIYGFQLEQGSYPTSYIPTYGTSQTRSADDMDTTFSSAITTNGSATIFFHELGVADSDGINTTGGGYRYQKDSSNYVSLATNDTAWRVRVQSGGNSNFKGLNDHPKTSPIKVAIVVTSNTFSVYANGVKELDNESLANTADFSSIDRFVSIIANNIGVRKSVQHLVFPTALTDSECIALTS